MKLLIVPYGIEIQYISRRNNCNGLLIVPYGIEICTNRDNFKANQFF